MKAVGLFKYLPIDHPESLVDLELPVPEPHGRDLLVRVRAVSVNPVDAKVRAPKDKVETEPKILGWDAAGGTLDMVVRWYGDGGHCPLHRHLATTTVLVLEGEQHLWDLRPDGTRGPERVRRAGDYALSTGDALPHFERGGPQGGLVFFGEDGGAYTAVDAESGKILWRFHTNQLWKASPMTYEFDSEQIVAVASGPNILAFALAESGPRK